MMNNNNVKFLSARITLLILALGVVAGFHKGLLSEGNFMILTSMVFTAFFTIKEG